MSGDYIIIRSFAEKDAKQIVELWNTCLPYDQIVIEKLLQLYHIPHYKPDGVLVAKHNGEIIGFLPTIVTEDAQYTDTGWILSLCIHNQHEHSGIGERLLETGLAFLKAKSKKVVEVANFKGFWFFPHFDGRHTRSIALLEKMGFKRGWELVDISKALVDFQTPQWVMGFYRIVEGEVMRTRVQLRKVLST